MSDQSLLRRLGRMKILGASLAGALVLFVTGIIFWGGFNTVMEATNTLEFCITCHEMRDTVYQEYTKTIHYENRTGVRAVCSDCHVPKSWVHKMVRKVQASAEIFHKIVGTIDTPEKFEARRLVLAERVWKTMKDTDSRECRNCHSFPAMNATKQKKRANKMHETAQAENGTCIDCHKGIAHKAVHKQPEEQAEAAPHAAATPVAAAAPAAATPAVAVIAPTAAAPAAPAAPAATGGINWTQVPERAMTLLYPGQTSYEWIQNGPDHGGGRAYKQGESCYGCHEGEQADMGAKMASGQKAETSPTPGKPASIKLTVQAAHDDKALHLRFTWPASPHTPAPFVDGGKMDAEHPVKLAMMIDQGKVTDAERSGCWSTCHHDARTMPDAPAAPADVTKYLPQTRTAIDIKGKPRGGWDKRKSEAELKALMDEGVFLDLIRIKSGKDVVVEDGYVSADRVATGGQGGTATATLADGVWTMTLTRALKSDKVGDISLEPGKLYTVGFAIHDDYTNARFHHVSINYTLGLDMPDAQINVIKQ